MILRSPAINDLPSPPAGKTGWPWREETQKLSGTMAFQRIGIVTPSLNQGKFIEETIRSVLLQGYPDFEYFVIDGGSTDDSVNIIRKYEKWLTYWKSEPDGGQSNAINKGFKLSGADIIAWINADDVYLPSVFHEVNIFFLENSDVDMIFGDSHIVNDKNEVIKTIDVPDQFSLSRLITQDCYILQPSVFFRRLAFEKVGGIDESYEFSMDYDLWVRMGLACKVKRIKSFLSRYRIHHQAKTRVANRPLQYHENMEIRRKYGNIRQKYQYYRHIALDSFKCAIKIESTDT